MVFRVAPVVATTFLFACASTADENVETPSTDQAAATVDAEAAAAGPAAATRPCAGAEYRQFDFWVGEWEVARPDGTPAGKNSIERVVDGCVLEESYQASQGGYYGHSFNTYDVGRKQWHQTWVDNSGLLLKLDGGLQEGRMVLRGSTVTPEGELLHEISWEPLEDGRVKQHWRTSTDGGSSWQDAFVGLYSRVDG